jgi:hypothetical protein
MRRRLAALAPGTKVLVMLNDETDVSGIFEVVDGNQMHLEGGKVIALDRIENVLIEIGGEGPE